MKYVELHTRSAFSFLEGASLPEALTNIGAAMNMPAMALLDRNGFYGSPRFHVSAKKIGMKAHVGVEVLVKDANGDVAEPDFLEQRKGSQEPKAKSQEPKEVSTVYYPLLCESQTGYQNLCRLLTRTKLRVPKHAESWATLEELEEHAAGTICLTGDESGPLARALEQGGKEAGRKLLEKLAAVFGPKNVYVELQRHLERHQEVCNQAAIELARELKLPIVATNGVCYATAEDREILDVFTCIKH